MISSQKDEQSKDDILEMWRKLIKQMQTSHAIFL